jgi:rod shape-determining protein MreB
VLQSFTRTDLAIDLGTAATRLHAQPREVPLTRPSVIWRPGGARAALRQGVVVDAEAAADVIGDLVRKIHTGGWRRPRALACVPTDASEDERAAVVEAVRRAGASAVSIVPEPLAAAVGAGLAVAAPRAQALVDIGEGVTDCAIVREGRVVAAEARRVAVADLREAVRGWIEEGHGIRVSPVEAERVLREAGVALGRRTPPRLHVVGSPEHGIGPVRAWLETEALHAALDPVAEEIAGHVGAFFAGLPEEWAREVADAGVCLTGGGALLGGMVERLVGELGLAVWRAPDPLLSVVDGARALARGGPAAAAGPR